MRGNVFFVIGEAATSIEFLAEDHEFAEMQEGVAVADPRNAHIASFHRRESKLPLVFGLIGARNFLPGLAVLGDF